PEQRMPSLGAYLGPLFAHAAKARLRETSRKWLPLVLISRGTLYLVTIGFGFALGRFADPIMSELGANPLGDVLGRHFVLLLLGLAATRGFFPARTRLDVEPYRYYPLSPFGVGLVSVLVDIPRWPLLAYVAGIVGVGLSDSQGVPVTGGAAVALVLLGVSASALGSAFREALIHRGKFVLVSVIVGVLAILTDGLAGSELLIVISQKLWLFVLSDVWAGAVALSIVMLVLLLCARVRSAVIKEGLTHEIPGIGGVPSWTERALTDW